jgi:hypothetical protein
VAWVRLVRTASGGVATGASSATRNMTDLRH